jgi:hypothetical protein
MAFQPGYLFLPTRASILSQQQLGIVPHYIRLKLHQPSKTLSADLQKTAFSDDR